jgi:hypothetical protein
MEPLLGNDQETNNKTTAIPRQQLRKHNSTRAVARQRPARNSGSTVGSGDLYGSAQGLYHSTDRNEFR